MAEHEPAGWLDATGPGDGEGAYNVASDAFTGNMLFVRPLQLLGWGFFHGFGQPFIQTPAGTCYVSHMQIAGGPNELVSRAGRSHAGGGRSAVRSLSLRISSRLSGTTRKPAPPAMARSVWLLKLSQAPVRPTRAFLFPAFLLILVCELIDELIQAITYMLIARWPSTFYVSLENLTLVYINPLLADVYLLFILCVKIRWNLQILRTGHLPTAFPSVVGKLEYVFIIGLVTYWLIFLDRQTGIFVLLNQILVALLFVEESALCVVHSVASAWAERDPRLLFATTSYLSVGQQMVD